MPLVQLREEWDAIRNLANEAPGVELARAATRAMCLVRQNFPFLFDVALTATPGLTPAPGSYQLTRWFWDLQCRETPIPDNQRSGAGLLGGQCPGVSYTVSGIVNNGAIGLPPNNIQAISITNCIGPLRDVWITTRPGGNGRQFVLNVLDATNPTVRQAVIGSDAIGTPVITNPRFTISPVDNCGPGITPPTLPVNPPPTTLPINVRIGLEERTRTITLPDLDTTNWPQFTFSPTIQVDGITFEFDIGGINITFNGGTALPPARTSPEIEQEFETVTNTINNVNNTVNQIENTTTNIENTVNNIDQILQSGEIVDLTEILNAIKCCCCEDNVTYETEQIVSDSAGGVFAIPNDTIAIVISGSNFDSNDIRTQTGGGSSPTVFYWGWCAVCYGDSDGGERIPLQFESQSLPVNELAKKILVSPTHNSRCSIVAIRKEKNCNEHG